MCRWRVCGACVQDCEGEGGGDAGTCERQAPNVRVSGVGLKGVVPAALTHAKLTLEWISACFLAPCRAGKARWISSEHSPVVGRQCSMGTGRRIPICGRQCGGSEAQGDSVQHASILLKAQTTE